MHWVLTATGVALALVVLRDVFHTLWHPSGEGVLSRQVARMLWSTSRRLSRRRRPSRVIGPLVPVVVLAGWTAGVTLAWALIYLPRLPAGFLYASGLDVPERGGLVDAFYVSMVALGTVGLGDIVPTVGWLRIVTALESLVGFALLTGAVSWILQIGPALARRRALALYLTMFEGFPAGSPTGDSSTVVVLTRVSEQLAQVRVDLHQNGETYYFRDADDTTSLSKALVIAEKLVDEGRASGDLGTERCAAALALTLDDFAALLDRTFLHVGGDRGAVFAAYARDQEGSRS